MAKPWGGIKIGSWAAESEAEAEAEAEAEEQQLHAAAVTAAAAATNPQTFPSLKESVSSKVKKKKMALSEFYKSGSGATSTQLTHDEAIRLPRGPTMRDPDDYVPGSGGGSWGSGSGMRRGGFDGGTGPRREYDVGSPPPPPPSRADEVDNWGSMKRNVPMERESRGGSGLDRYRGWEGGSRADEGDNWGFDKKPVSVPSRGGARSSSFGSGFRDSGSREEAVGRRRLVLEPRSSSSNNNNNDNVSNVVKANPFGAARPREEVLAEKGLDWKKLESEIEAKKVNVGVGEGGSRPASSQGSRPTSSQSNRSEIVGGGDIGEVEVQQRPKVNPFGDAKPREVLLEEKGLDWRKIDLQLEQHRVDRPETEEERALKDDIEILKKDLEKESGKDVSQGTGGEESNLRCLVESKERELGILTKELDDKIRFSQRPVERPGSGSGRPGSGAGRPGSRAGRYMGFSERPPSQSGSFDDYRSAETMDRPRSRDSRGTRDVRIGPGEDRRGGFQGNRDRGFGNNRNFNRSALRW